uniref:Uncharacterized protein n=1 Tax=Arundo donax TaxID=35708 RepID=A0A0A9HQR6_ARUDO
MCSALGGTKTKKVGIDKVTYTWLSRGCGEVALSGHRT